MTFQEVETEVLQKVISLFVEVIQPDQADFNPEEELSAVFFVKNKYIIVRITLGDTVIFYSVTSANEWLHRPKDAPKTIFHRYLL